VILVSFWVKEIEHEKGNIRKTETDIGGERMKLTEDEKKCGIRLIRCNNCKRIWKISPGGFVDRCKCGEIIEYERDEVKP
jgi:hypothetical protein